MEIIIIWISLSLIAAVIAKNKGRSGIGFLLLALILSPLIGVIAALVANPNVARVEQDNIRLERGKRCPFCAEIIKRQAVVCRYCGRELNSKENPRSGSAQTEVTNLRIILDSVIAQTKGMNFRSIADSAIGNFKRLAEMSGKEFGRDTKCPYCGEVIKREARVCRSCGRELRLNRSAESETTQRGWGRANHESVSGGWEPMKKLLLLIPCSFLLLVTLVHAAQVSVGAAPKGDTKTVAAKIIRYNFPQCKRVTAAVRLADESIQATCDGTDYRVFTVYIAKEGKMVEVALNCTAAKRLFGIDC
jgi:hypothetical protein